MAEALSNNIRKLREKSRTLLARVDEDSKRVAIEVRKLRSQVSYLTNCNNYNSQSSYIAKRIDLHRSRNNSSGVSAVLCPDYFRTSPKLTTVFMPDIISTGKLTLTSKKPREASCLKVIRKPVKECYCHSEANKQLRSRTLRKPCSSCRQCKSQIELRSIEETNDKALLASPISCETYRRVQRIDYTPRSQFLRNVQSKICGSHAGGDCLLTCPRSPSYHRFMANARMQDSVSNGRAMLLKQRKNVDGDERQRLTPATPKTPANSIASEQSESDRDNVSTSVCVANKKQIPKGTRTPSQKQLWSRSMLRKTFSSMKRESESSEAPMSSVRVKTTQSCHCCGKNASEKVAKSIKDKRRGRRDLSEYHERTRQCQTHDDDFTVVDNSVDREVEDLRKFREQNYCETHGSSHTLMSSGSSNSLQQHLLNERLFPEPVRRIHKRDLVVTMPPCATIQKKRIHYFPRHVVQQERSTCNTNYRRKRYQSCPLTGHAIDLGVLKTRPPLNSLALKHQKRAP